MFVPVFSKFLFDFAQLPNVDIDIFRDEPEKKKDIRLVSLQFVASYIGLSSADPALFPGPGQNWMPVTKDLCSKGTPTLMFIVYTPPNGGTPIPLWCDENGKNGFNDARIQRAKVIKDYPSDPTLYASLGHIRMALDNHPERMGDSVQMIVTMIFIMVMLIFAPSKATN